MIKTIDFNGLSAGTIVDGQYAADGVTISAVGGSGDAMIFDSANPTGGDTDLGTNNLGGVLIISEDGDSSDPDDNAGGGCLVFDFTNDVRVKSLTFLDIEETARMIFYDADGNVISNQFVGATGDGEQSEVVLNVEGVSRMEVVLNGSGAVDNLVYDDQTVPPVAEGDGIVSGDDGDDLIDLAYTGDPEGDRIDAGDAILPGEAANDDIVDAGAGNDTVIALEGDDDIYAGSGDDVVDGGAGNDVIYGDSNLAGGSNERATVRESFEWDLAGVSDAGRLEGFTQDTGNAKVTYSILSESDRIHTEFSTDDELVSDIVGDGEPINANSSLDSEARGEGQFAAYKLAFDLPVTNVDFRINDIDGDGIVRVLAYDAAGKLIDIDLEGGSCLRLIDTDGVFGVDTADSQGGYQPDTSATYSLLVNIAGPVSRIVIEHGQDGSQNSGINVTDVYFDVVTGDDGVYGNDVLMGGDGDDEIFGEGGDDTLKGGDGDDLLDGGGQNDLLIGGEGNDSMFGGADRDTFVDVNAGDVVNGNEAGDDFDTLDLTGSAPVGGRLEIEYDPSNVENGTVFYFDQDNNAAGELEFSNIEKVIPCFTPGTKIATPKGERLVEELKVGDRVITRDNGIQEIRWVGARKMTTEELDGAVHLRPVLIRQGALGNDLPERDMMVSPNHRVLVANDKTALYFEEREVLVAAKHLTGLDGVDIVEVSGTTYIHIMFDQHEVILSDGTWTESFQPGDMSLAGIGNAQRQEILELFPELSTRAGIDGYTAARKSLKRHEAKLVFKD